VTVEQPHEGSPVNPPREVEPGDNGTSPDRKDQPERLGTPTGPLPEEVEASDAAKESPGPTNPRHEATPEPMTTESRTNSLAPIPDPEEAGIEKESESPQQFHAVFGTIEVRRLRTR